MALWEAEARHARELSVFGAPKDDLYTGVCHLFLLIYRCARLCPALRVKPTRFQAYSSRAGTLEGSRLAKHKLPQTTTTTTTNTTTTTTTTRLLFLLLLFSPI